MITKLADPFSYQDLNSEKKVLILNDMLNISVDCIKLIHSDGRILFMNRAGCEALGVDCDETEFGMDWLSLLPVSVHHRGKVALRKAQSGQWAGFRGMSHTDDGEIVHWDNMLTPVPDPEGKTACILCISRNITEQVKAEERLKFLSEYDALSGLANRRTFHKFLKKKVVTAKKEKSKFAVLYIDLDNFKNINDSLGHAAGDKAIQHFSSELKRVSPDRYFLSRLGGDEFAVVMHYSHSGELTGFANSILTEINRKVVFKKACVRFGITVGAAIFPHHGVSPEELLSSADQAMYLQKKAGKNGFRIYSPDPALDTLIDRL